MTRVDSNIFFDLLIPNPAWYAWSVTQIDYATAKGPVLINDIVYAELCAHFELQDEMDDFVADLGLVHARMPNEALFAAANAFKRLKARGSSRTSILPDFFIGAHAAALACPILTRDARRYRSYFPRVALITPQT